MYTLFRYFLFQRPFRHLPTQGLHFLVLGNSISLVSGLARHCWLGLPTGGLGWLGWALASAALVLLGLVVQAAVREYAGRPDKPRRFWQLPRLS